MTRNNFHQINLNKQTKNLFIQEICIKHHKNIHILWAGNLNFIAIILRTDTEMWTYIYKKDIYCRIYYSDQLDIN